MRGVVVVILVCSSFFPSYLKDPLTFYSSPPRGEERNPHNFFYCTGSSLAMTGSSACPRCRAPMSGASPEKYPCSMPGRAGYFRPQIEKGLDKSTPPPHAALFSGNTKSGAPVGQRRRPSLITLRFPNHAGCCMEEVRRPPGVGSSCGIAVSLLFQNNGSDNDVGLENALFTHCPAVAVLRR